MQKMTDDRNYEEGRREVCKVFAVKKELLKQLATSCEKKVNPSLTPEEQVIGSLGLMASNEFVYVYDCIETMFLSLSEAFQNAEKRIEKLEKTAKEMNGKLDMDEIASVAKFAEDFNKQVEESKKAIEEYKKKMRENDLAT
jgi:proteasome assembly chaperone (PAC2) family protein